MRPLFAPLIQKAKKRKVKILTVGGTNGKGEVCFSSAYLLGQKGKEVALWTSPHIVSVTERFQFNGEKVSEGELLEFFMQVHEDLGPVRLSYYEFLFYTFCLLSLKKNYPIWILEVGLGGRFDAVNLFDADFTALVSISRDHLEILGNTYSKILNEKLGITRTSVPLLSSLELKFCRERVKGFCVENQIPHLDLFEEEVVFQADPFFKRNRIIALSAAALILGDVTNLKDLKDYIQENLPKLSFPMLKGRFETFSALGNQLEFIGAHNLDGFRKVVQFFLNSGSRNGRKYDKVVVSFSKRPIEEVQASIEVLLKSSCLWKEILFTSFDHPRALSDFSFWKDEWQGCPIRIEKNWKQFIEESNGQNILFIGSYYFIGEVQKFLKFNPSPSFNLSSGRGQTEL